jgi:hypothetical protein
MNTLNCLFPGHFKESLDLQGFSPSIGKLSTKLSTESLEICKVTINQRLRTLTRCTYEEVHTSGYGKMQFAASHQEVS